MDIDEENVDSEEDNFSKMEMDEDTSNLKKTKKKTKKKKKSKAKKKIYV